MDVETLLRESDPTRGVDIPDADSAVGHRILHAIMEDADQGRGFTVGLWKRAKVRASVAASFAIALTIVLIITLPGANGSSPSAAAVTLSHLASQASQDQISLGQGEYFYTEVQTPISVSTSRLSSGAVVSSYLLGTVQTWVANDGSGRQVLTTDPTPRFFTNADRALWVAVGQPAVTPAPLSSVQNFGRGSASEVNGPVPLYDVSGLPTEPNALAAVLSNEDPGRTSFGSLPSGISTLDSGTLFTRTVALLQGPDIGETAAFRTALYEVLATVPGVQLVGSTTDPLGRSGLGFQVVQRTSAGTTTIACQGPGTEGSGEPATVSVPYPASIRTYSIVVDPRTSVLLSYKVTVAPSEQPALINACNQQRSVEISPVEPTWTVVVAEGIVDSNTGSPATGSS